jgi:hypothetical protein
MQELVGSPGPGYVVRRPALVDDARPGSRPDGGLRAGPPLMMMCTMSTPWHDHYPSRTFPCTDIRTISFCRGSGICGAISGLMLYTALAEAFDPPLLTRDQRLAAAPGQSARPSSCKSFAILRKGGGPRPTMMSATFAPWPWRKQFCDPSDSAVLNSPPGPYRIAFNHQVRHPPDVYLGYDATRAC